jgi:hypothetical protein
MLAALNMPRLFQIFFFYLQLLDLSSYSSKRERILERVGFISIQVPDHNFVPEG